MKEAKEDNRFLVAISMETMELNIVPFIFCEDCNELHPDDSVIEGLVENSDVMVVSVEDIYSLYSNITEFIKNNNAKKVVKFN